MMPVSITCMNESVSQYNYKERNVEQNELVMTGAALRRAVDAAYETHTADREIPISNLFGKYIKFPESYQHVTKILEAAGFKIYPPTTTTLGASFVPGITARINKYKTGFGFSVDIIIVISTDSVEKPNEVSLIEGTIFQSYL